MYMCLMYVQLNHESRIGKIHCNSLLFKDMPDFVYTMNESWRIYKKYPKQPLYKHLEIEQLIMFRKTSFIKLIFIIKEREMQHNFLDE